MNINNLVGEVRIEDRASANLDRVGAAADRAATSLHGLGRAEDAISTKTGGSTRQIEASARSFESLKRAADPAYATLARLADQQVRLQRSVSLGTASQAEANAVYDKRPFNWASS